MAVHQPHRQTPSERQPRWMGGTWLSAVLPPKRPRVVSSTPQHNGRRPAPVPEVRSLAHAHGTAFIKCLQILLVGEGTCAGGTCVGPSRCPQGQHVSLSYRWASAAPRAAPGTGYPEARERCLTVRDAFT